MDESPNLRVALGRTETIGVSAELPGVLRGQRDRFVDARVERLVIQDCPGSWCFDKAIE
jgi:hypothetical protein